MQLVFLMQGGSTPLAVALQMGHLDVIRLLVEMGADPAEFNKAGRVRRTGDGGRGGLIFKEFSD